jgi:putative flippase GtrA
MNGPPRGAALVVLYAGFAVLATLANLAAQRLVLAAAGGVTGGSYTAALAAGTLVGLVVKYTLDKRWIFQDATTGMAARGRQFALYTLMGVATTALFWVTQTGFWLAWGTELARETGAVLGLSVGYVTKYMLDRRYVFRAAGMAS